VHKFDASFHDVLTSMIKDESESQSVTTTPESRSFFIAGQRHPSAMPNIRMELLPGGKSRRDQAGNWRISQATGRDVKDIQM
jgi:hypothetical protein